MILVLLGVQAISDPGDFVCLASPPPTGSLGLRSLHVLHCLPNLKIKMEQYSPKCLGSVEERGPVTHNISVTYPEKAANESNCYYC